VRPTPLLAILHTNVLVSALLFNQGRLSWLNPRPWSSCGCWPIQSSVWGGLLMPVGILALVLTGAALGLSITPLGVLDSSSGPTILPAT
jgi:hypothetical protein